MATLPVNTRKHKKGQDDHVDAWLMSYADLITLLFIFFVIFVSGTISKRSDGTSLARGEPVHPYIEPRYGLLQLGMPYDVVYSNLQGVITAHKSDQTIAVERTDKSLSLDLSALKYFVPGTADIVAAQLPILQELARTIKNSIAATDVIEVEGHTDDTPLTGSTYANNWELASMRAARITEILIDNGVDPAQIRAVSYAGGKPLVPNKDAAGEPIPENEKRNQRVVVKLEAAR